MHKKLLWMFLTFSVLLTSLLIIQVNIWLSGDKVYSTSYTKEHVTTLAYLSKSDIQKRLGKPESKSSGRFSTGHLYEEWVYEEGRFAVTFTKNEKNNQFQATRFSVKPKDTYQFPQEVPSALDEIGLEFKDKPVLINDNIIKWENVKPKFSIISVSQNEGRVEFLNVVLQ